MLLNSLRVAVSLCLIVTCAACSFAPKYERPEQPLPAAWTNLKPNTVPLNTDWWTRFNDPVLTSLINEALAKNEDLAQSMARIKSAAAQAGVGSAALWPSINASGAADAAGASEKTPNTTPFDQSGLSRWTTTYTGTVAASWELDFWGATRNQYTALTDTLMQTVLNHEALRLSTAAQVANSYFSLLAMDMQLDIAKRTLKTREDALKIYTSRYRQGDLTELDWQRAKAEVETARSTVHSSIISVDAAEASLALLTGRSPKDIIELKIKRGARIQSLPTPPVFPEGLPSQLLERRPDIRAAEFALMATNANIGVARAQFFPSISLTGSLGTVAAAVSNLFSGPAAIWAYGASVSLPIFNGGRYWYNLKDAEAKKEGAIALYRQTVKQAFSDIRTSLTSQQETQHIVRAIQAQVDSLRRAVQISRLQYDNGYTDYLTVLDAERELFSAELSLATAMLNRLNAVVSVCQALGGGWQDPGQKPSFPIINTDELVQANAQTGKGQAATAPVTPVSSPATR